MIHAKLSNNVLLRICTAIFIKPAKSGFPPNVLNRKIKTQNINEDNEETQSGENEEGYSEIVAETNEESIEDNLLEDFENNKHDSLEVSKNEEITKLKTNSSNSHSDTLAINNLQKLFLNATSQIADKYVSDQLYGLNKAVDRMRTEQCDQTCQMEEIAKL